MTPPSTASPNAGTVRVVGHGPEAPPHDDVGTGSERRTSGPGPFVLVPAVGCPPASSAPRIAVRGILLRSILLLVLDHNRPRCITVAELGAALETMGFTVPGRIGKSVSDALRAERARGRVRRCGRGRYTIVELPRTTRWRCRQRVVAALAGDALPQHLAPRRAGATMDPPPAVWERR